MREEKKERRKRGEREEKERKKRGRVEEEWRDIGEEVEG